MLFDCLGLGVGLWASVAATWKPDGVYTFGYARVETLSGFANGECGLGEQRAERAARLERSSRARPKLVTSTADTDLQAASSSSSPSSSSSRASSASWTHPRWRRGSYCSSAVLDSPSTCLACGLRAGTIIMGIRMVMTMGIRMGTVKGMITRTHTRMATAMTTVITMRMVMRRLLVSVSCMTRRR
jgi:zinc transporter 5/7